MGIILSLLFILVTTTHASPKDEAHLSPYEPRYHPLSSFFPEDPHRRPASPTKRKALFHTASHNGKNKRMQQFIEEAKQSESPELDTVLASLDEIQNQKREIEKTRQKKEQMEYHLEQLMFINFANTTEPDNRLECGETPLCCAISHRIPAAIRTLLNLRANPDLVSQENTPLCLAITSHAPIEVLQPLLDGKADPNLPLNGETPLFVAITNNANLVTIQRLINARANPSIVCNGVTPLELARAHNIDEKIITILEEELIFQDILRHEFDGSRPNEVRPRRMSMWN